MPASSDMKQENRSQENQAELVRQALSDSVDYQTYRERVARHVAEGTTSGNDPSEAFVHYTLLNHHRMLRWDKKFELPKATARWLSAGVRPQIWLVLTETWCGDAAPVLPVMNAFAGNSPEIELRIAERDAHPQLMNLYRTDGALAIPKLLVLDPDSLEVLASWGPRPAVLMRMVRAFKEEYGKLSPEFRENMQHWYNRDKGQALISELVALLTLEKIGDGAFLGGTIRFAEAGA